MTYNIYEARTVKCEAFRLEFDESKPHRWLRKQPPWFIENYNKGLLHFVNSEKNGKHVTIFKQGGNIRAIEGDWIIKNDSGTLFVMDNDDFNYYFKTDNIEEVG